MAEYVQMFNGNQPFKNGSYIYGKINKEIVPVYYTGGKTDTVQVSIDNQNRTITADLLGSVKNPINDEIISNEYTWSSQKIDQGLSSKVEIDDNIQATTTTWSSSKIGTFINDKNFTEIKEYTELPIPVEQTYGQVAVLPNGFVYVCIKVSGGSEIGSLILGESILGTTQSDAYIWQEIDNIKINDELQKIISDNQISSSSTWSSSKITDFISEQEFLKVRQFEELPQPTQDTYKILAVLPDGSIHICIQSYNLPELGHFIVGVSKINIQSGYMWARIDNSGIYDYMDEIKRFIINDEDTSHNTTWSSSKILEYGYNKYLNYITPSYLPQPSVDYTNTIAIIQDSAYMCLPQVQSGSIQYQWVDLINDFEDIHGENSENISIEVTGDKDKTIQVLLNDTVQNLSAVYISKSEGMSITASNQLTTKKYVDDKISSAITAAMGDVDQQLLNIISGGGV